MTPDPARRDHHVHTPYCNHAAGTMEEYVQAGVRLGLEEIGFLEHIEAGITYPRRTWLTPELLEVYFQEGQALKAAYADRIRVVVGVEVGFNPEAEEEIHALLRRFDWERVALSVHFVWDPLTGRHLNFCSKADPVNAERLTARGVREMTRWYYATLAEGIARFRPHLACHLDVLERTLPSVAEVPEIQQAVDQVLTVLREAGTAVEINTSGYTHRGALFPAPSIIRQVLKRGIPWALSSDAHAPAEVGRHFARAQAEVASIADKPAWVLAGISPVTWRR